MPSIAMHVALICLSMVVTSPSVLPWFHLFSIVRMMGAAAEPPAPPRATAPVTGFLARSSFPLAAASPSTSPSAGAGAAGAVQP